MKAAVAFLGLLLIGGCSRGGSPSASETSLKAASDVFWALNDRGYVIAKEKPSPSVHGCTPFEFLAAQGQTRFRISVFECEDENKARSIVDNQHTRYVDHLLRNKQEGGVLRRGRLEIIVRWLEGEREKTAEVIKLIESL
jgi:hypothetical protein